MRYHLLVSQCNNYSNDDEKNAKNVFVTTAVEAVSTAVVAGATTNTTSLVVVLLTQV